MHKYTVVWSIELKANIEADTEEQAVEKVGNKIDCQTGGEYVEDSYNIISIETLP